MSNVLSQLLLYFQSEPSSSMSTATWPMKERITNVRHLPTDQNVEYMTDNGSYSKKRKLEQQQWPLNTTNLQSTYFGV